jgi:hypothetical protein
MCDRDSQTWGEKRQEEERERESRGIETQHTHAHPPRELHTERKKERERERERGRQQDDGHVPNRASRRHNVINTDTPVTTQTCDADGMLVEIDHHFLQHSRTDASRLA